MIALFCAPYAVLRSAAQKSGENSNLLLFKFTRQKRGEQWSLFTLQTINMSLDVDITRVVSETLAKLTVVWDEIGSPQEERRAYVDQYVDCLFSGSQVNFHKDGTRCACRVRELL